MSNTQRPSLNRTTNSKTVTKNRNAALDEGVTIVVDGRKYTVTAGELTGLDVMALRKEVGMSFQGLIGALQTDADVDLIAALMWLARRLEGETTLAYADVAAQVGYDVEIEIDEPEADTGEE